MEYDNTNSGALFRDSEKKSEKAPDYTGKLNVEGKEWRIAGWLKGGKKGKFLSLKVSEPLKGKNHPAPSTDSDLDGDGIPF